MDSVNVYIGVFELNLKPWRNTYGDIFNFSNYSRYMYMFETTVNLVKYC